MGVCGKRHAPDALYPGKDPVALGWAPGPVWTGAEKHTTPPPPGFRSPALGARCESLY
jgi:hypothetical protein